MTIIRADGLNYLCLADREPLKDLAVTVGSALRSGNTKGAELHLGTMPELGELGVTDALLGRRVLGEVPWTPLPATPHVDRVGIISSIEWRSDEIDREIRSRGVRVEVMSPVQALTASGDQLPRAMYFDGVAITEQDRQMLLTKLAREGISAVNPYSWQTNAKDIMAERWAEHGVATPETVTRLTSDDAVAAAYERLGPEVVLKGPKGAHGDKVKAADDVDTAQRSAQELKDDPTKRGALMQRRIDVGNSDVRIHFVRDWKTGDLLPVGAIERRNFGDGFKTNLSGDSDQVGVRPIYDMAGGDPALPQEAIDLARRAGDAMGYDEFAADVAIDRATGKATMFEVDIASMVLERHFPVPRDHSVYKHLTDLLIYGDAATIDGARGASLVPEN